MNLKTGQLRPFSLRNRKKNEEGLQGLRDTIKRNNLPITGVQEKRGRKKQKAYFKDIMTENFPNLRRYLDIQVYKVNKSPSNFNPKPSSQRHIIIKLSKIRDEENLGSYLTQKFITKVD